MSKHPFLQNESFQHCKPADTEFDELGAFARRAIAFLRRFWLGGDSETVSVPACHYDPVGTSDILKRDLSEVAVWLDRAISGLQKLRGSCVTPAIRLLNDGKNKYTAPSLIQEVRLKPIEEMTREELLRMLDRLKQVSKHFPEDMEP